MTVKEIVREHLVKNGFTGLYNHYLDCGCPLDDLMPCECNTEECRPGYKYKCSECNIEFCVWYKTSSKKFRCPNCTGNQ